MFDDVTHDVILPLGWAGSIFLAENESHIYPNNVCQIWLRSDGRVEKKWGVRTDRQTKKTAALYNVFNDNVQSIRYLVGLRHQSDRQHYVISRHRTSSGSF